MVYVRRAVKLVFQATNVAHPVPKTVLTTHVIRLMVPAVAIALRDIGTEHVQNVADIVEIQYVIK